MGSSAVTVKKESEEIHLDTTIYIDIDAKPSATVSENKDVRITQYRHVTTVMKHRINLKEVLLSSNATPIKGYGDLGYKCCYCSEQYLNAAELKDHTLETHHDLSSAYFMSSKRGYQYVVKLDITNLQCKICEKSIDKLEEMFEHLKNEHQKTIYTDIKNRIIPLKFLTDMHQCCICQNVFSKFMKLIVHMNTHYRNYICEICDASFVNSGSLKSHRNTHNIGTFKCNYCPQVLDTNNKRREHEKSKHGNKRLSVYKCALCIETFSDYRKKEAHMISTHGSQAYNCKSCDKVFMASKALSDHVRRNHLMERRFKCSECDKTFFTKTEVKNHMARHTAARFHKCTVCPKAFARAKTLAEHMKIHDDVRRFKCEHCGSAFVQKCSWRGHMRSKHAEIV